MMAKKKVSIYAHIMEIVCDNSHENLDDFIWSKRNKFHLPC